MKYDQTLFCILVEKDIKIFIYDVGCRHHRKSFANRRFSKAFSNLTLSLPGCMGFSTTTYVNYGPENKNDISHMGEGFLPGR